MLELLDSLQIRAALAINGSAIDAYEPISRAAHERGWEFIGHGFSQKNMQKVEDERTDIRKTSEAIKRFTGKPPRGWLGPGLTETWETPDLLVEEGYEYVCDWVLDDQPVRLKTRTKPIVNVPYTQECNDVAMMLIQHHRRMSIEIALSISLTNSMPMRRVSTRNGPRGAPLYNGCASSSSLLPRSTSACEVKGGRGFHDGRANI